MATLAAMPKYDVYRDSGFNWIGQVPNNWEVTKLGVCLSPVSIKNRPDFPLLSITRELGVIKRDIDNQTSNHNFIPDDLSGYKLLKQGQFGMNKMKAWQGSYGVSKYTGIVSPAYYIFDFVKPIEGSFFNWAIRSKLYVSYFGSSSDGVRIGQWDLSKDRMKSIPFILPSPLEQTEIAVFLDEKTAQIDEAIAIKEKQIVHLKERKQIIIQKAVTQGLKPNVPMKYSGVEWIGKIPEHWEVKKFKYLLKKNGFVRGPFGSALQTSTFTTSGIKVYEQKNAIYDDIFLGDSYISLQKYKELSRFTIRSGDLLMSCSGTIGKITQVPEKYERGIINQAMLIMRVNMEYYDSKYFIELFRSDFMQAQIIDNSKGSAMKNLVSTDIFKNMKLVVPPKEEQLNIFSFIQSISSKLNEAIKIQTEQIEKLKEFRITLINSAVTGKIKVA